MPSTASPLCGLFPTQMASARCKTSCLLTSCRIATSGRRSNSAGHFLRKAMLTFQVMSLTCPMTHSDIGCPRSSFSMKQKVPEPWDLRRAFPSGRLMHRDCVGLETSLSFEASSLAGGDRQHVDLLITELR